MYEELSDRQRSLGELVRALDLRDLSFLKELCGELKRAAGADCAIIGRNGKAVSETGGEALGELLHGKNGLGEAQLAEQLKSIYEFKEAHSFPYVGKCVAAPLYHEDERLGTLVIITPACGFSEGDLLYIRFFATVLNIAYYYIVSENQISARQKAENVRAAMATLSYSELEAVVHILKELNGTEGRLVASKVADEVGITRSVIVNALRKLESAGAVESRSLGMKGTYIKVLNEMLLEEIKKY